MRIEIESYYDGWSITIDGHRYKWDQDDEHEVLREIFEEACPDAVVTYEECY